MKSSSLAAPKVVKRQLSVQPVMKISSKWLHFRFSDSQSTMLIVIWSNQLQSVTVTCSPPRYAAWVLMFTLSVTTFTMDNALLVPDKFHNIQSKYGAVYQVNYHMNYLSLRPGDHSQSLGTDVWCASMIFCLIIYTLMLILGTVPNVCQKYCHITR